MPPNGWAGRKTDRQKGRLADSHQMGGQACKLIGRQTEDCRVQTER